MQGDAPASQVERVFRLLRFIADGGSTANVSDVARHINVNRVTVMRLLESLKAAGLIEVGPQNGAHQLTMPFLTLAASALGTSDLTARARQILPQLVEKTGLTAYLVVRDGAEIVYLLRETPETPLVSRIRVGSRIPAHRATPGLAMLAHLDAAALRDVYVNQPGNEDEPEWDGLTNALDTVRANGCAWSFSGLEAGIDSCAAAVSDSRGNVVAALSVAGPHTLFANDETLHRTVESNVKSAADELSRSGL